MNAAVIKKAKQQTRRDALAARREMGAANRAAASARIVEAIAALEVYARARRILLFYPMPEEVDVLPLLLRAQKEGRQTALPRVADRAARRLEARVVEDVRADVAAGFAGILEPREDCRALAAETLDLIIAPAAAVGRDGGRVGYGGGFYDTLLGAAAMKDIPVICAVFACQIFPAVPRGKFDAPITAAVTENELVQFQSIKNDRRR